MTGTGNADCNPDSQKHMPHAAREPRFWKAVVTLFIPLSTLAFVLLGYGYALAIEASFGVSAGHLASSLTDHLQLSTHAFVHIFNEISRIAHDWHTYTWLYAEAGWILWLGSVLWALVFGIYLPRVFWRRSLIRLLQPLARMIKACAQTEPIWIKPFRRGAFAPFAWIGHAALRTAHLARKLPPIVFGALASLLAILGWPLVFSGIGVVTVLTLGIVYSWFPLIGYVVGQSALNQWVVKPEQCIPTRSRDQRLLDMLPKPKGQQSVLGAACICIEKDGKEVARGRLVLATENWALLFDPVSGQTRRVPVSDAVIIPVDSLDGRP